MRCGMNCRKLDLHAVDEVRRRWQHDKGGGAKGMGCSKVVEGYGAEW